jgi:carboxylate-amine ligase
MTLIFNSNPTHTLGVELELAIVDLETGELTNGYDLIARSVPAGWEDSIKPEFKQSYVEVNTDVCATVDDVRKDLTEKILWLEETAATHGMGLLWTGTHPFSQWDEQATSPGERYAWLTDTMQYVADRLVVFGMHVHVGVSSGDKAIQMCDRLLRHIPTLLALSANSPNWCGRDTGLDSYRTKVMESLPTAGMPHTLRNWSEYNWLIDHLRSTGFIQSAHEIWWDARPHAQFGTVELRVMDMPWSMEHMLGLAALTQCLIAGISDVIDQGAYLYDSHPMIATQNKWHAVRYGLDAHFVDFDTMQAIPARQAVRRLTEYLAPIAQRLGCATELGYIQTILTSGNGAANQRVLIDSEPPRVVIDSMLQAATGSLAQPT